MRERRFIASLRLRLLAATLAAAAAALGLAGVLLSGLFRDHVMRQFEQTLTVQLDQVTARLEFDAAGRPRIDPATLTDPRWTRPYSGLYWQLDELAGGTLQRGVLRSRSLWDAVLPVAADALVDGTVHVHEVTGPQDLSLRLLERTVRGEGGTGTGTGTGWRLMVAADPREARAAVDRFTGVLAASLAVLLVLLGLAAWAQVAVGLAPLRALQRALGAVHTGQAPRIQGRFPHEVQPLVDDFNAVLDRNAEVVTRARTQAGNLAHAIKTPLAAMAQAAASVRPASASLPPAPTPPADGDLAAVVIEQVAAARRHVDWHLARARAAAAQGVPGMTVAVAPVVEGLLRVMDRVHAARGLDLACEPIPPQLAFSGEEQDLHEILGNLLDNACKWARQRVRVSVSVPGELGGGVGLRIVIEDDGPGIDEARRPAVLARGSRLDESVPGTGLGLAIVHDLVTLYGGGLTLGRSPWAGLRVTLALPGTHTP